MKNLILVLIGLAAASCTVADSGSRTSQARPSGKIITVTACVSLEFKEREGFFIMQGPDGEWADAPPPMEATGRFDVTFDDEAKRPVVLPWPGKEPPRRLYQDNIKATVLVETKEGKNVFTILKMESGNQTIYEGEPEGS